jgi:hypothetical protein
VALREREVPLPEASALGVHEAEVVPKVLRMVRVRNWLLWVAAVAVLLAIIFGFMWRRSEGRILEAEQAVDSLTIERRILEDRAQRDSLALDSARTVFRADSTRQARDRAEAVQRASQASQRASEASQALRVVLDSLGGSTALLDDLEAAHEAEVGALEDQLAAADSATQTERSLRLATERALASERLAHQGTSAENLALRENVLALESARRGDKFRGWLTNGVLATAVVTILVLR